MKILAFSDLHLSKAHAAALVEASSGADLVVGAGDFCNMRHGIEDAMALLEGIDRPMILVPGNAESVEELTRAAPAHAHVLHGSGVEIDGRRFFGLGYAVPQTPFGGWSCDLSEAEAEAMLGPCEAADMLILHSPPKGIGDVSSRGQSLGSTALLEAIRRIAPKLAVCGHIHDSWGSRGTIGPTEVVNLGPTPNWFEIAP